jgi:hypothetical protein
VPELCRRNDKSTTDAAQVLKYDVLQFNKWQVR